MPAAAGPDRPALEDWFGRLHEHRWVKVEARMDEKGSLHAEEITEFDDDLDESELETTVVAVDSITKTLRSRFGTPIVVTDKTRILGGDKMAAHFAALRVGDHIEVEGKLQRSGKLLARSIKVKNSVPRNVNENPMDEHEVRARIERINARAHQIKFLGIWVYCDEQTENKTRIPD